MITLNSDCAAVNIKGHENSQNFPNQSPAPTVADSSLLLPLDLPSNTHIGSNRKFSKNSIENSGCFETIEYIYPEKNAPHSPTSVSQVSEITNSEQEQGISYPIHYDQSFSQKNNLSLGNIETQLTNNDSVKYRSFIPSIFISAALPLKDVKKNVFDRKYNNITLHLSSPSMVPYGKFGRLLLSVLTTHAVQSKNNLNKDGTVTINYTSLQELLDEMQLRKQRGKDVMEQLNRFKSATFIYEEENVVVAQKSLFPEIFPPNDKGLVQAKKLSTGNIMFIDSLQYIELDDGSNDKRSISFSLVLNNKFVDLCKKHSVPIDYSVYKEISSAMGKDLYAWIVYRNNSIGKDGLFIPRSNMVAQFSGTIQPDQERANFKYIVEQVQQIQSKYYPDLRFSVDRDNLGITFYKSPQVMAPKDTRYVLVTNT